MNGITVLLLGGLIVVGIAGAISAIFTFIPYLLALVALYAIARMLVRESARRQSEKDETHSPEQTRPD